MEVLVYQISGFFHIFDPTTVSFFSSKKPHPKVESSVKDWITCNRISSSMLHFLKQRDSPIQLIVIHQIVQDHWRDWNGPGPCPPLPHATDEQTSEKAWEFPHRGQSHTLKEKNRRGFGTQQMLLHVFEICLCNVRPSRALCRRSHENCISSISVSRGVTFCTQLFSAVLHAHWEPGMCTGTSTLSISSWLKFRLAQKHPSLQIRHCFYARQDTLWQTFSDASNAWLFLN